VTSYTMVQVDIIFVLSYTSLIDIHFNSYIIGTRVSSPRLSRYHQQILTMLMLYNVVLVSMFIPAILVSYIASENKHVFILFSGNYRINKIRTPNTIHICLLWTIYEFNNLSSITVSRFPFYVYCYIVYLYFVSCVFTLQWPCIVYFLKRYNWLKWLV
jgi:hypothetical protein